jgi:hypothetical protein
MLKYSAKRIEDFKTKIENDWQQILVMLKKCMRKTSTVFLFKMIDDEL